MAYHVHVKQRIQGDVRVRLGVLGRGGDEILLAAILRESSAKCRHKRCVLSLVFVLVVDVYTIELAS